MHSGLSSLLGPEPDFSILAPGEPSEQADLALWDAGAGSSGAPALLPSTPTLALVRDEDAALDVLRAGAVGVLLRDVEGERLLASLRAVAAGAGVFEPAFLRSLLSTRAALADGVVLTPREAEVLALMAEGLSNKLIADRLKISDHTAKFHVNSILTKLSAETRTEAVVVAARRGLLML